MVKMWETSAKFSNIYVEQLTESSHIGLMSSEPATKSGKRFGRDYREMYAIQHADPPCQRMSCCIK